MKVTKRILWYIAVLVFLVFMYIWCCNSFVLFSAGVLLIALALSLVCAVIARKNISVSMTATVPENHGEGELTLQVMHKGVIHLGSLVVALELRNVFMNTKETRVVLFPFSIFSKKQENGMEFQAKYSGLYQVEMATCKLQDLFGMIVYDLETIKGVETLVMPEANVEITGSSLDAASQLGERVLDQKGDDRNEIYNLRDYNYGDLLKDVHWKLYAKAGEKFVREGSLNVDEQVCLMYNISPGASMELKNQLAEVLSAVAKHLVTSHILYDGVYLSEGRAVLQRVGTVENSDNYMEYVLMNPLNQSNHELLNVYASEYGSLDATHIVYVTDNVDGLEHERNRLVVLVHEQGYQIMEV